MPEIAAVNETFESFAEEFGIPATIATKFNVIFDELLDNIVTYAYSDGDEHDIEGQMKLAGKCLTVKRRLVEPLPSVYFVDRRRRGPSVAEGRFPGALQIR